MNDRIAGRVERLKANMERQARKIAGAPKDPRVEAWKVRWLECRDSLANLRDHGRETPGTAPAGVEIEVPAAPFTVKQGEG